MSSYEKMVLIPNSLYNAFLNHKDSAVREGASSIHIRQLNNLDVHDGGEVTIRNDNNYGGGEERIDVPAATTQTGSTIDQSRAYHQNAHFQTTEPHSWNLPPSDLVNQSHHNLERLDRQQFPVDSLTSSPHSQLRTVHHHSPYPEQLVNYYNELIKAQYAPQVNMQHGHLPLIPKQSYQNVVPSTSEPDQQRQPIPPSHIEHASRNQSETSNEDNSKGMNSMVEPYAFGNQPSNVDTQLPELSNEARLELTNASQPQLSIEQTNQPQLSLEQARFNFNLRPFNNYSFPSFPFDSRSNDPFQILSNANVNQALHGPMQMQSLTAPPNQQSLTAPPVYSSLPAPQAQQSLQGPPQQSSLPAPPVQLSLPPPPAQHSLIGPPVQQSIQAPPVPQGLTGPPVRQALLPPISSDEAVYPVARLKSNDSEDEPMTSEEFDRLAEMDTGGDDARPIFPKTRKQLTKSGDLIENSGKTSKSSLKHKKRPIKSGGASTADDVVQSATPMETTQPVASHTDPAYNQPSSSSNYQIATQSRSVPNYQSNFSFISPTTRQSVTQSGEPWRLPFINSSDANMLDALNYDISNNQSGVDVQKALEYVPSNLTSSQMFIPPPPPQPNFSTSSLPPSQTELYNRAQEIVRVGAMLRNWAAQQQQQNVLSKPPQMSARNMLSGPSDRWSSDWDKTQSTHSSQPLATMSPLNKNDQITNPSTAQPLAITHDPPPPVQDLGNVNVSKSVGKTTRKVSSDKAKAELNLLNQKLENAKGGNLTVLGKKQSKSKQQLWLPLPTQRKRSHQKDSLDLRKKYTATPVKRSATKKASKKQSELDSKIEAVGLSIKDVFDNPLNRKKNVKK